MAMPCVLARDWLCLGTHPTPASEAMSARIANIGVFVPKFLNLTILNSILHI
jgi:hypothetical protein